jgi:para-nitrobenzyl esterase
MQRFLALCTAASMYALSAGLLAAIPQQVVIDTGTLRGTTGANPSVRLFRGIPFAAPPLAENRWRAPAPAASWDGVRDASEFGPRCMQGGPGSPGGATPPPTGEDCLYLNVWTTAESARDRLPVMVWI